MNLNFSVRYNIQNALVFLFYHIYIIQYINSLIAMLGRNRSQNKEKAWSRNGNWVISARQHQLKYKFVVLKFIHKFMFDRWKPLILFCKIFSPEIGNDGRLQLWGLVVFFDVPSPGKIRIYIDTRITNSNPDPHC